MRRTKLSLYYLATYLTTTGLGLMLVPDLTLSLLFSNRRYDDIFVRFSGGLMFALGLIVIQVIRKRIEVLYPMTLVIRSFLIPLGVFLYFKSKDPLFLVVLAVVSLGMVLTGISYFRDRKRPV
jgi:hypothetical protein